MQLDPSSWLVSWAGFVYDWIITREWRRVLLCLLPAILLAALGLAVAAGSWSDRGRLAQRYLERGNEEIANWEEDWATIEATVAASSALDEAQSDDLSDDGTKIRVSPFAEALFRRVHRLSPSDRSQFVIALTLAQRGANQQAKTMLARIAPEKGRGYVPAHAMLAQLLALELNRQPAPNSSSMAEALMHHAEQAKDWERVPRLVLLAASDLNMMFGKPAEAIQLLTLSAERFPQDWFFVARLALQLNDQQRFDEARAKAQQILMEELAAEDDEHRDAVQPSEELDAEDADQREPRLRLAQLYAMSGELDEALELLQRVPEDSRSASLKRMLSDLYVARYDASLSVKDGRASVNFQDLDNALRIEPSNPLIAQAVAKLVRMQGPRPSEELIANLIERLATGSATTATHAYIAELYLTRLDFANAIPHLEQVITRLPTAAQYLNNLAYCLAELHPERYEEALAYSRRAIELSKAQPVSDYYDTLSHVLSRLGRHSEAVTAIESAVELSPDRADFHIRAAAEYRQLNMESLAVAHERLVERLEAMSTAAAEDSSESGTAADSANVDAVSEGSAVEGSAVEESAVEGSAVEESASEGSAVDGSASQEGLMDERVSERSGV